jgi:hypothetical protein
VLITDTRADPETLEILASHDITVHCA